jgi:hypothetical protein
MPHPDHEPFLARYVKPYATEVRARAHTTCPG